MRLLNIVAKLRWNFIPNKQIDPERQLAFFQRFFQCGDRPLLLRGCKNRQIQIGSRARRSFDALTVNPDRHVRQIIIQQIEQDFALIRRNINSLHYRPVCLLSNW